MLMYWISANHEANVVNVELEVSVGLLGTQIALV